MTHVDNKVLRRAIFLEYKKKEAGCMVQAPEEAKSGDRLADDDHPIRPQVGLMTSPSFAAHA